MSIAVVVVLVVSLARRVSVEGEVIVTTSLWPYFELAGLRVASAPGVSDEDLITMERARVTVGLLPLLDRQLHILSFAVEGLSLNLVRSEDGQVNWAAVNAAQPVTEQEPSPIEDAGTQAFGVAVDQLLLGDLALRFEDRPEAQVQTFTLREAKGAAPFGEPMSLKMHGLLREEPYTLSIAASSLKEFLAMAHTRVDLQIDIAGTRIEFGGFTDRLGRNLRTELELAVRGDRLDSLNRLLDVDLPPLENYSLDAGVVARPGRLEITGMDLRVGDSVLRGTALLDDTASTPVVSLDLVSDSLQLVSGEQSVLLRVSVKPSRQLSDASLRFLAENIDLAALIRLLEPDSDVGGVLSVMPPEPAPLYRV